MNRSRNTLLVLVGPTAVGKTDVAIQLAKELHCPIINCDSRQMYREMSIGTAVPSMEERQGVPHYFIHTIGIDDYYSAALYENEVMSLLNELFKESSTVILSGGSMMYVDAVCEGVDDIPTVDPEVRIQLQEQYQAKGLDTMLAQLKVVDPAYYDIVDRKNYKRVVHALEIYYTSGKPYSSFRKKEIKNRPFRMLKVGLERPREELFQRINARVDQMMEQGLWQEAQSLYPYKDSNALNTVGYKELFHVMDGEWGMQMAVERIKKNTRVYAKKQMLWFKKDTATRWFHPADFSALYQYLLASLQQS